MTTSYTTQDSTQDSTQETSLPIRQLGMPMPTQSQWLELLSQSKYANSKIDFYNQGELVSLLEQRVAKILNKPAALFFGKGMIAQFSAFKAAEAATKNSNIILHPMSHVALDEDNSYQSLLNLNPILLGKVNEPFDFSDVCQVKTPVATLAVEMPLRRAGFKLIEWEQLQKMSEWSRHHKVHFHMDGARLWESTFFYQKSEADIAALFNSVYVSLYKGIGAMGGAILAGESEFIDACKIWRSRFGGCSFTFFPLLVSALEGLDNRLQLIPSYVKRAKTIAEILSQFPQLIVNKPQTNGFFVFLEGNKQALSEKSKQLNLQMGIQLFNQVNEFPETKKLMIEIQVGALHQRINDEEIAEYFRQLLKSEC